MMQQIPDTVTANLPYYTRQAVIARCAKDERSPVQSVRVIEIKPGHGRHIHDDKCGYREGDRLSCLRYCDDSDIVVTLAYQCPEGEKCYVTSANARDGQGPRGAVHEHHAIYGILDGKIALWAD